MIEDYFIGTAERAYTPRVEKKLKRVLLNNIKEAATDLVNRSLILHDEFDDTS